MGVGAVLFMRNECRFLMVTDVYISRFQFFSTRGDEDAATNFSVLVYLYLPACTNGVTFTKFKKKKGW